MTSIDMAVKAELGSEDKKVSKTIFHQLLDQSTAEGKATPPVQHMVNEGLTLVGAATDTVGNALMVATYHTLSNRQISDTLTAELKKAFPDPSSKLDFLTLEKLPNL